MRIRKEERENRKGRLPWGQELTVYRFQARSTTPLLSAPLVMNNTRDAPDTQPIRTLLSG